MNKNKLISPSLYAKTKGVSAAWISKSKDLLVTEEIGGKWFVVDCKENDSFFKKPSHNSKRFKKGDCVLCYKNGVDSVDCNHIE